MTSFSDSILQFYFNLKSFAVPHGVTVLNPYADSTAAFAVRSFYKKYFNDYHQRYYIFGINPGRFGGGITGIPFTDPVNLKQACSIEHSFTLRPELSSEFIYRVIQTWGSVEKFYSNYFLTAVCPLGFTLHGKNMNYYDDKSLLGAASPFIESTILKQVDAGAVRKACICLGEGENYKYLKRLNDKLNIFSRIIPLAHPRFIMQYKRKQADDYVRKYHEAFKAVL